MQQCGLAPGDAGGVVTAYEYDALNRLTAVVQDGITYTFSYNALGDRLQQTVITEVMTYTLDLYAGLTQVLMDGANVYLYGLIRIGEEQSSGWTYHLADALGSVRQLADEDGWVTLVQSYRPYGDVLESSGAGTTAYGYAGEWTDVYVRLIYLRSRYYAPATGRFLTRDTWPGDYTRPLSLNPWNYVEGNPVNNTDPTGMWMWGGSGNPYHTFIELHYEGGLGIHPFKHLEYSIPGTQRRVDMFNSMTGDVYEIEPWMLQRHGAIQVQGYVADLRMAAAGGRLTGTFFGWPYNWNATLFHVGTGVDWPGKYRMPLLYFPVVDLVADYVGQGVVIYWLEPNALAATLPFLVPNKRLVKPPNWSPLQQPAYQPSYQPVMLLPSWQQVCRFTLISVGGIIIAVTIVEDIATLGLGTFNDVVTVPAGILFIKWGHRLAAFVPATVP